MNLNNFQKTAEALSWLQSNPNRFPFAGNRFDKQEAIDFVKRLYELSCSQVDVTNLHEEGGSYADTFIAVLPTERRERSLIFYLYNEERVAEGLEPEEDDEQEKLEFWWD